MSILDTFYLVFKGDTSDLKKKTEDVKKTTDEASHSFEKMNDATNRASQSFLGLGQRIIGLVAAFYSADAVIGGFRKSLDYAIQIDQASRALGVNVEALDAWGNAVTQTGGSAESFQSTLRSLAGHLGTTSEIALKVLPQFANSFKNLGLFRAMNLGKALGLDEPTILLLMKGRREVEAMITRQKELGVVSKKQAEIAHNFNLEMIDTGHAFRSLFGTLGESVLPTLTRGLELFVKLAISLRTHKDFVIGALIGIGVAVVGVTAPFIAANAAIIGVTAAIAGLIGAFGLVYEDMKAFAAGHDSLTGRILSRWPEVGKVIKGVASAIKSAFDGILSTVEYVIHALEKAYSLMSGLLLGGSAAKGSIKDLLQRADNPGSEDLNSQTTNSIFNGGFSSKTNSTQIGDITVHTNATDAEGTGTAVAKHLNKMFAQAINNSADGVVA